MQLCIIGPIKSQKENRGGVTEYNTRLIEILSKRFKVTALTITDPPYEIKRDSVTIYSIHVPFKGTVKNLIYALKVISFLIKKHKELPKHVIVEIGGLTDAMLLPFLKIIGKRTISIFHMSDAHKSMNSKVLTQLLKHTLDKSDEIIAVSNYSKKNLIKIGLNNKKITVIYPPLDKIMIKKIKPKRKTVLYFGRLTKEKGVDMLLSIAKEEQDITFLFAGEGYLVNEIKKIKNAKYLGYLKNEKLYNIIASSELIVFPTRGDALPLSIIQTMMIGKPIISTKVGAIPEVIKNKDNGILVTPGKKEEIRYWINKIINDNKIRQKLSKNAKKTSKEFLVENISKKILHKIEKWYYEK